MRGIRKNRECQKSAKDKLRNSQRNKLKLKSVKDGNIEKEAHLREILATVGNKEMRAGRIQMLDQRVRQPSDISTI